MAICPVCKMSVQPDKAAAKMDYAGQNYYFCSGGCHKAFSANTQKYADITHGSSQHNDHK